jgi:outer membrane immunogenic protein
MRNSELFFSAAFVSAMVGIGAASAADMTPRTYTKAPIIAEPGYNWTGFYVGVNAGGVWSQTDFVYDPNPIGFPASAPGLIAAGTQRYNHGGFSGGGQAGYNWQAGLFVFGMEADVQYTDTKGTALQPVFLGTTLTESYKSDWLATFRGRVGITSGPVLFYATGGLALADVHYFDSVAFPGTFNTASSSETRTGYAAGGGVEWAVNQHWSVKGEFLYVDLGKTNYTSLNTSNLSSATILHEHRLHEEVARVGLNYKWGGPIVAKY